MSKPTAPAVNDPGNDEQNYAPSSYAPSVIEELPLASRQLNYAPSSYAPSVIEESPAAPRQSNYAPSSYAPSVVEEPTAVPGQSRDPSTYAPSEVELAPPPSSLGTNSRPPASRSSGSAGFDQLISILRGVPEVAEVPRAPETEVRRAPESTYAESAFCYSEPAPSGDVPAKDTRDKPVTAQESKAKYYKAPPALIRAPEQLYNQNCGAKYKTVGAIKRSDAILFQKIVNSEQMVVMQVLAGIYFYRMNSIPRKNALKPAAIRGIFDCDITDYQFSIHELYKRLAMRKGRVHSAVGDYNFWALPAEEMDRFRKWLQRIGSWRDDISDVSYPLWTFGKDASGKLYIKLKLNDITLNWIQLLNCMYDSLAQWTRLYRGVAYIRDLGTEAQLGFNFC